MEATLGMTLTSRKVGKVLIFDITGNVVDREGARSLMTTLLDSIKEGHRKIILNMVKVEFIDGYGIGGLVFVSNTLRDKNGGGAIKLLSLTDRVKKMMELTEVYNTIFEIFEDEEKALASFK